MSDERDSSALPRWEELLRRLEHSHRRLEEAQADYLEASAESQRALARVIDTFGEIAETVREIVPEPTDSPQSAGPSQRTREDTGSESVGDQIGDKIDPDAAEQGQNTLPARLHSRGVSLPKSLEGQHPTETDSLPVPMQAGETSTKGTQSDSNIEQPRLVPSEPPDGTAPFSGLREDARIVLTNDGFGVAAELSELLSQQGYRVRVEGRRPELTSPVDTLIFLGSLRAPSSLDDAMSIVEDAIATAEMMTTRMMQPKAGFVAAVDTAGGFGLSDFDPVSAPLGALLGLVRLLDNAHPGATTKLIDIDGGHCSASQLAEILADELFTGADQSPIAWNGDQRLGVEWEPFDARPTPASWLDDESPPLVYLPGPNTSLATAVERLAIAHELPVAILGRRQTPRQLPGSFEELGIDVHAAEYRLDRLFSVMDFLDEIRDHYGPIAAIVAESVPAQKPNALASWEVMRTPLDEFNALLAMTINDPLQLLGVGIAPRTPPVVASALRYFARAESLRRNDHLQVRLAHLHKRPSRDATGIDPRDFALTEFLSGSTPALAEVRFDK